MLHLFGSKLASAECLSSSVVLKTSCLGFVCVHAEIAPWLFISMPFIFKKKTDVQLKYCISQYVDTFVLSISVQLHHALWTRADFTFAGCCQYILLRHVFPSLSPTHSMMIFGPYAPLTVNHSSVCQGQVHLLSLRGERQLFWQTYFRCY